MSAPAADIAGLVEIREGLPDGWAERGNLLWAPPGAVLPTIATDPHKPPPSGSTVTLLSPDSQIKVIRLWGHDNAVRVGRHSLLLEATINCGDGARVILGDAMNVAWAAWIDARNGGSIEVGDDGLWSSQVRVATDDMHAIMDLETGRRVNKRGSAIRIGAHVWIGMDAVVLPGVSIGDNAVIGIRAVVAASVPANAAAVGVPARVVRRGITWSHEDVDDAGEAAPLLSEAAEQSPPQPTRPSWIRRLGLAARRPD